MTQIETQPTPPAASPSAPPTMLRVKPLALDTFRENAVLLSRCCTAIRPERLAGQRKVELRTRDVSILASPIICDDPGLVGADEAGIAQPAFRRLGLKPGDLVQLVPARPPATLDAVRAKIAGQSLSADDYAAIARDLAAHRWSDMEVAAFLVGCAAGMTPEETLSLTRGMVAAGNTLHWDHARVVDKHCIGGIPGNRTSLIVTPIVAAHGLVIPKTSSRAITSPAGTADTMEVFARVDLDETEMRAVVDRCGGCIIWGGRVALSPADDVLISVERPLSIDTHEQMVASILSKKIAAGSGHLVLDLPVGPTAKVRDPRSALTLKKLFEFVAARMGLGIEVVITRADEPVGFGIGPLLEARDVRAVLANAAEAPADLRAKAIRLAGHVLENDPALRGGTGEARARELLESGAARAKMDEICEAQGPSPIHDEVGELVHEVRAPRDGRVTAIDCARIAAIARLAGAPTDAGAGIQLLHKTGAPVRRGEPLYRIHACAAPDFGFAVDAAGEDGGVRVSA